MNQLKVGVPGGSPKHSAAAAAAAAALEGRNDLALLSLLTKAKEAHGHRRCMGGSSAESVGGAGGGGPGTVETSRVGAASGTGDVLRVLAKAHSLEKAHAMGRSPAEGTVVEAATDKSEVVFEMDLRDHSAEGSGGGPGSGPGPGVSSSRRRSRRRHEPPAQPTTMNRRRCRSDGDQDERLMALAGGNPIEGMDVDLLDAAAPVEPRESMLTALHQREGRPSPASCPDQQFPVESLLLRVGDEYDAQLKSEDSGGFDGAVVPPPPSRQRRRLPSSRSQRTTKRRYSDGDQAEKILAAAGGLTEEFFAAELEFDRDIAAATGSTSVASDGEGGLGAAFRAASPASCPDMQMLEEQLLQEERNNFGSDDTFEMELNDVVARPAVASPKSRRRRLYRHHRPAGGPGALQRSHSDGDITEKIAAAASPGAGGGLLLLEEPLRPPSRLEESPLSSPPPGSSSEEAQERLASASRRISQIGHAASMPFPAMAGFSLGTATSAATAASRLQLQQMQLPATTEAALSFAAANASGGSLDASFLMPAQSPPPVTLLPGMLPGTQSATSSSSSLMSAPATVKSDSALPKATSLSSSSFTTRRSAPSPASPWSRRGSLGALAAVTGRRSSAVGYCRKEVTVVKAGKSARRPSLSAQAAAERIAASLPAAVTSSSPDAAVAVADKPASPKSVASGSTGSSGSGAKKRGWKKPKDKPKRPLSAYNLFFQAERNKIIGGPPGGEATLSPEEREKQRARRRAHRKTHGKIGFAALAQTIAAKWREISPEERRPYEERAEVEKARYRKELEAWKLTQTEKRLIEKQKEKEQRKEQMKELQEQQGTKAGPETNASETVTTSSCSSVGEGREAPAAMAAAHTIFGSGTAAPVRLEDVIEQQPQLPPRGLGNSNRASAAPVVRLEDVIEQHPHGVAPRRVGADPHGGLGTHMGVMAHVAAGVLPALHAAPPSAAPLLSGILKSGTAEGGTSTVKKEPRDEGGMDEHNEDLFLGPIADDFDWSEPLNDSDVMAATGPSGARDGADGMDSVFVSPTPEDMDGGMAADLMY